MDNTNYYENYLLTNTTSRDFLNLVVEMYYMFQNNAKRLLFFACKLCQGNFETLSKFLNHLYNFHSVKKIPLNNEIKENNDSIDIIEINSDDEENSESHTELKKITIPDEIIDLCNSSNSESELISENLKSIKNQSIIINTDENLNTVYPQKCETKEEVNESFDTKLNQEIPQIFFKLADGSIVLNDGSLLINSEEADVKIHSMDDLFQFLNCEKEKYALIIYLMRKLASEDRVLVENFASDESHISKDITENKDLQQNNTVNENNQNISSMNFSQYFLTTNDDTVSNSNNDADVVLESHNDDDDNESQPQLHALQNQKENENNEFDRKKIIEMDVEYNKPITDFNSQDFENFYEFETDISDSYKDFMEDDQEADQEDVDTANIKDPENYIKLYKCSECNTNFSNLVEYELHKNTQCECEELRCSDDLINEIQINRERFKCPFLCGRDFLFQFTLNKHLETHKTYSVENYENQDNNTVANVDSLGNYIENNTNNLYAKMDTSEVWSEDRIKEYEYYLAETIDTNEVCSEDIIDNMTLVNYFHTFKCDDDD